jgi:membrane fusion protein, heavy metal efflux system
MKSLRSAAITVAIWKRSLLPVVPLPALLAAAFYAGAHVGTRSPMEQGTSTTLGMTAHHGNLPDQVTLATEVQDSFGLSIQSAVVRPITRTIPTTGLVGYTQTGLARVRPLARGRLESIIVSLGDSVQPNQILGVYDNPSLGEARNQLRAAQEGLMQARADAEAVRAAYERAQKLAQSAAISRAELERQTAELARVNALIQTKLSDLEYWEVTVKRFTPSGIDNQSADRSGPHKTSSTLAAPFSGIVMGIGAAPGEIIEADREVFTIANLDTLWAQASVFQNNYAHVHVGYAVTVRVDAYPDQSFAGTVAYVSDALDPNSNTARVQCEVVNHGRLLKPNMFASIEIEEPLGHEGVTVPDSAIQIIDDRPVVFVKSGHYTFMRRDVSLGVRTKGWTEITQGINAGEIVVSSGSFRIKSAMPKPQLGGDG